MIIDRPIWKRLRARERKACALRITAQSGRRGMKHLGHFIAGEHFPADSGSQIFNPSNGRPTAIAAVATNPTKVDLAFPTSN
jgi:hypothetical protein